MKANMPEQANLATCKHTGVQPKVQGDASKFLSGMVRLHREVQFLVTAEARRLFKQRNDMQALCISGLSQVCGDSKLM